MINIIEIDNKDSFSIGKTFGKKSRIYSDSIIKVVNYYIKMEKTPLKNIKNKAITLWEEITKNYQEFIEEAEGFCNAMKMDKDFYLIYQMLPYLFTVNKISPEGCTAAIVKIKQYQNLFLFKNKDYRYIFRDLQLPIIYHEDKQSYDHVSFGNVGWLGCDQGINIEGFVSMLTWCDTSDRGVGIQNHILNRILLKKAKNVEDAINILKSQNRTGGCNFLIADKYGNAKIFENGKNHFAIREIDDSNTLVATNHFVSTTMMPFTPQISEIYNEKKFVSSRLRYIRMIELLQKNSSQINIPKIIKILSDHKYGKHYYSICCHGETIGTIGSFIAIPKKRQCFINTGYPCNMTPFKEIHLKGV